MSDSVNRGLSRRLGMNRQISENAYWFLPVDDTGHENFMPVGRGQKTCPSCGQWSHFWVCHNIEGHKGVVLKGVDYTGKLVVTHQHLWCHKSSCPVCFIRGYSVREARLIEGRLAVASELGFGDVEHMTVSVPFEKHGLLEPVLREECRLALLVRGVLGGCMIFHGFRIDRSRKVLVWSPHYHCLGFVRGGLDVCRACVHKREDCASCLNFRGRGIREYAKDGYVVKAFSKRQTVVGTAFYQLHHASIRVGLKRFHVVTWFGLCGNSKLKGRKVVAQAKCPVCHDVMVKEIYRGKEPIAKDIGDPEYRKVFPMDAFDASGAPNFVDVVGSRFGG
jgi:hypothetical protein